MVTSGRQAGRHFSITFSPRAGKARSVPVPPSVSSTYIPNPELQLEAQGQDSMEGGAALSGSSALPSQPWPSWQAPLSSGLPVMGLSAEVWGSHRDAKTGVLTKQIPGYGHMSPSLCETFRSGSDPLNTHRGLSKVGEGLWVPRRSDGSKG